MPETRIARPGKQKSKAVDTREVNARRVSQALRLAYQNGGWTTPSIVALALFYSETENRLTYAQRLLASAAKGDWLLARTLPVRSHALAYVLTQDGAERLAKEFVAGGREIDVRAGTTWGVHKKGGSWEPPARWIHDERAARFIHSAAHSLNPIGRWSALNETQVRRMNPGLDTDIGKYPDGLLVRHGAKGEKAMWVEVEQARKTGDHRRKLLAHLAKLAAGHVPRIRIGHDWNDYADIGKQAFLVLRGVEETTTFTKAAHRWIGDHPQTRLLYQVVTDDQDGLALRMGPLVDLGTSRNA